MKNKYEGNPFRMVVYIIVVILLVLILAGMVLLNRKQRESHAEKVEQMAARETEFIVARKQTGETTGDEETETDTAARRNETEDETTQTVLTDEAGKETNAAAESETGAERELAAAPESASETAREPVSETASESESETEAGDDTETEGETKETQQVRKQNIIVLNGTDYSGVAAYWKSKLQDAGFENISIGTYTGGVLQTTEIYTSDTQAASVLKKLCADAEFHTEHLTQGIRLSDGETMPDTVDVWMVVGNKDASAME